MMYKPLFLSLILSISLMSCQSDTPGTAENSGENTASSASNQADTPTESSGSNNNSAPSTNAGDTGLNSVESNAGPFKVSETLEPNYEQVIACDDPDDNSYLIEMAPDGQLKVAAVDGSFTAPGTYTIQNNQLTLSVPNLGFNETSTEAYTVGKILAQMKTPSLICRARAHRFGEAVNGYYRCPTIRYIPKTRYQDNAFEFYPDHSVKRRRWDELIGSFTDTLYREFFGVYYIEGNRFFMAFGNSEEDPFITGTINADGSFVINEMEPEKGACNQTS